jgi:hypothetical protein
VELMNFDTTRKDHQAKVDRLNHASRPTPSHWYVRKEGTPKRSRSIAARQSRCRKAPITLAAVSILDKDIL